MWAVCLWLSQRDRRCRGGRFGRYGAAEGCGGVKGRLLPAFCCMAGSIPAASSPPLLGGPGYYFSGSADCQRRGTRDPTLWLDSARVRRVLLRQGLPVSAACCWCFGWLNRANKTSKAAKGAETRIFNTPLRYGRRMRCWLYVILCFLLMRSCLRF